MSRAFFIILVILTSVIARAQAPNRCVQLFTIYPFNENSPLNYNLIHTVTLASVSVSIERTAPMVNRHDLTHLIFNRLPALHLQPVNHIQMASEYTVRQRILEPRKNAKIDVDVFDISQVSEDPLLQRIRSNMKYNSPQRTDLTSLMYLGEVQGQPVMVSSPLKTDENGFPLYSDRLYKMVQLQEVGVISSIGIGKDPSGAYRIVMPLHEPGSVQGKQFTAHELLDLDNIFVNLAKANLPFFQQSFELDYISALLDTAVSFVELSVGPQGKIIVTDVMFVDREPLNFYKEHEFRVFSQPNRADNYSGPLAFRRYELASSSGHFIEYLTLLIDTKNYERALQLLYLNFMHEKVDELYFRDRLKAIGIALHDDVSIPVTGWVSQKGLNRHAKKHGFQELGLTQEEYDKAAKEFFESYDYSDLVMTRLTSQTIFKYNLQTGEFGLITPDGKIITYYFIDPTRRDADIMNYLGENAFSQ